MFGTFSYLRFQPLNKVWRRTGLWRLDNRDLRFKKRIITCDSPLHLGARLEAGKASKFNQLPVGQLIISAFGGLLGYKTLPSKAD